MTIRVRHFLHADSIRPRHVRGLKRDHGSGNGLHGDAIHDLPADPRHVWAHYARRERRLQTKISIAFLDDGGARVEINVQVHGLPRSHMDWASHDLPGRNL